MTARKAGATAENLKAPGLAGAFGLADGGQDGVDCLVEGEVGGVDGVGGDAFVVGAAEAEAALG